MQTRNRLDNQEWEQELGMGLNKSSRNHQTCQLGNPACTLSNHRHCNHRCNPEEWVLEVAMVSAVAQELAWELAQIRHMAALAKSFACNSNHTQRCHRHWRGLGLHWVAMGMTSLKSIRNPSGNSTKHNFRWETVLAPQVLELVVQDPRTCWALAPV